MTGHFQDRHINLLLKLIFQLSKFGNKKAETCLKSLHYMIHTLDDNFKEFIIYAYVISYYSSRTGVKFSLEIRF